MNHPVTRQANLFSSIEILESRRLLSANIQLARMDALPATALEAQLTPAPAVALTSTELTQTSTASTFGQAVTLIAKVSPVASSSTNPTGTVTFKSNGSTIGTASLSYGKATLVTSKLPVGSDKLTASYGGALIFSASASSTLTHTVAASATRITLQSSLSPTKLGQSFTLTAALSAISPGLGIPTGSVQFIEGTNVLGTASLDKYGHASVSLYNLYTGSHSLTAKYLGNSSYKSSNSSALKQTINLPAFSTSKTGLKSALITAGSGSAAANGQWLKVDYTGYLLNGVKFDSSLNSGRTPFDFSLGQHQVIAGWDEGLLDAKVGDIRVLMIPPSLGYGALPNGSIPANSTLVFVVRILAFDYPQLGVYGGTNFAIHITNNQTPSASSHTDFGSVKLGLTSATYTFGIRAIGPVPLRSTGATPIVISGTNPGDFTVDYSTIFSNNIFSIRFNPKAKGSRSAKITIPTNDAIYPNFSFTVVGVGT